MGPLAPSNLSADCHTAAPPPPAARPSRWAAVWSGGQFVVALGLTIATLLYLLFTPASKPAAPPAEDRPTDDVVQAVGTDQLRVNPDTPLGKKIQTAVVRPTKITSPVLTVTGTVVASLRPGNGKGSDYWQFNSPEVLTAYTDWRKATADIAFARTQLAAVGELAAARLSAQQAIVIRLEKLFESGSDPKKDLDTARADLIQTRIQGRKDTHEADTAVQIAVRNEAALARQLQQAGLDPAMLQATTSDSDIVMADVPEGFLDLVKKVGKGCDARFFGIQEKVFPGTVTSIAPTISRERRSLRVLFAIHDPDDQLRPGMFAEIGLGTDPRSALLAPAEGVVHVGRTDYLLVEATPGVWRVTAVEVGEVHEGRVEIVKGLQPGQRVIGQGAILLKPFAVKAAANGTGGGK